MKTIKILIFALFFISLNTYANDYESIESIKTLAQEYVQKNIDLAADETLEFSINSFDIPGKLAKCSQPINISLPKEAIREKINSIEITCNGEQAWHSYIPVNVQIFSKVVVANHEILMNDIIREDDLNYSQININRLFNGYFKNKKEAIGFVAAQNISQGLPLSHKNLRQPQLVHKNTKIDLIARKNAVSVTMVGIAKSDGHLNEVIIVYNPSSKKTLEALVIGLNKAEVLS